VSGLVGGRPPGLAVFGGPDGAPCEHAAFLSVGLTILTPGGRVDRRRSRLWLWVHGDGVRRLVTLAGLGELVDLIAMGDVRPGTPFSVVGGTAMDRDEARAGSGEFAMISGRSGMIDAWGLFSPRPADLIREVRAMAGVPVG
jgi:hypothetical protein